MGYGFCRNFFIFDRFHYLGGVYMFVGLLLLALVVYLIFKNNNTNFSFNNAESILKERLAKGEISEEEYDKLIKKTRK